MAVQPAKMQQQKIKLKALGTADKKRSAEAAG